MNTFYKAITIAIIMTVAMASRAQNAIVHFGYDGDGNRISRTLTIDRNEEKSQAADSTTNLAGIIETLDDDGNATLSIYPNPTHDILTVAVDGLSEKSATLSIITVSGSVVLSREMSDGKHEFDLSEMSPGIYMLLFSSPNITRSWKIIKD
jgi:YD repeat-containing protein